MPVHRLHLLGKLKHQCFVVGLPKQACHFGMPLFSENEHLTSFGLHFFPGFMYSFLELAYNGTGGINEFSSFPFYLLVGGRRFSMGSEKQGLFFVLRQLVELGRMEPQLFEALKFFLVVYDGANTGECSSLFQMFLGQFYGARNAKTKTRFLVNFDMGALCSGHTAQDLSFNCCITQANCAWRSSRLLSSTSASSALRRGLSARVLSMWSRDFTFSSTASKLTFSPLACISS